MKHKALRTFLTAVLLALAAAMGGIGCLVSAFRLTVVSPRKLVLCWLVWAVFCGILDFRRWGSCLLLAFSGMCAGYFWHTPTARDQMLSLVYHIARFYDQAYGIGTPDFPVPYTLRAAADYPLVLYGSLTVFSLTRTVCRRKGTGLSCALTALPLALCLVVTDTVPDTRALLAVLGVIAILLVTENVRKQSLDQSTRLAGLSVLPVALALALLTALVPKETYINRSVSVQDTLVSMAEQLPRKLRDRDFHLPISEPMDVDLAKLRGQETLGIPVMEVTSENGGTVYLRGQDYDRYTGTRWESTPQRTESLSGIGSPIDRVSVVTRSSLNVLYLPCFPENGTSLESGRLANSTHLREYQWARCSAAAAAFPEETLLALPAETADRVRPFVEQLAGNFRSTEDIAAAIAAFVSGSADYDRKTGPMPASESDFVVWFLNESDTGYCVHFAASAVVLLRSVGIPARYVTGYKAETVPGEPITVTSDDAHAWAEYYNYTTQSWHILEATPGVDTAQSEKPTKPASAPEVHAPAVQPRPEPSRPAPAPASPRRNPILPKILLGLLIPLLAAGLIYLQRLARLAIRAKRLETKDLNRRCLILWQETIRLAALRGLAPPEVLCTLAEKARFSQHRLTDEELQPFLSYRQEAQQAFAGKNPVMRLIYKYYYCIL